MKNIEKILSMTDEKEKIKIINKLLREDKPRKRWKKYDNSRWSEKYKALDRKHRKHLIQDNAEILRKKNLQPEEISVYPKGTWKEGKKYCSTKSQWQRNLEKNENYRVDIKDLFTPTLEKEKRKDKVIKNKKPVIIFSDGKAELYTMKSEKHTVEEELNRYKIKKGKRVVEIKCLDINNIDDNMVKETYEIDGTKMTGKDLLEVVLRTGIEIYEVIDIVK